MEAFAQRRDQEGRHLEGGHMQAKERGLKKRTNYKRYL